MKFKNPGMKSKNPYKLTSDSMFGNLWIDQEKLNNFKLEAHKHDKKVLSHKADQDLIDLLTKLFQYQETVQPTVTQDLCEAGRSQWVTHERSPIEILSRS